MAPVRVGCARASRPVGARRGGTKGGKAEQPVPGMYIQTYMHTYIQVDGLDVPPPVGACRSR